jgi:hypothetical protein
VQRGRGNIKQLELAAMALASPRRKVPMYHGKKCTKGSFFVVNEFLPTICIPWSIDRYGFFEIMVEECLLPQKFVPM